MQKPSRIKTIPWNWKRTDICYYINVPFPDGQALTPISSTLQSFLCDWRGQRSIGLGDTRTQLVITQSYENIRECT